MKKRIISLALVVVMAVMTLVGCGFNYNDDMSEYATVGFNKDETFKTISISFGDFDHTDPAKRAKLVLDAINTALAKKADTEQKYTGAEGEPAFDKTRDILYYCYYAVVSEGQTGAGKVVYTSYMNADKAISLQLGLEVKDDTLNKSIYDIFNGNHYEFDGNVYTTKTEGSVEDGNVIYVSFTKTYDTVVDSQKGTATDTAVYHMLDANATGADKAFYDHLVGKVIGYKHSASADAANFYFDAEGNLIEGFKDEDGDGKDDTTDVAYDKHYTYTNYTAHFVSEGNLTPISAHGIKYGSTAETTVDLYTGAAADNAKVKLTADTKLDYYMYPVYYVKTPEINATNFINLIYGSSIATGVTSSNNIAKAVFGEDFITAYESEDYTAALEALYARYYFTTDKGELRFDEFITHIKTLQGDYDTAKKEYETAKEEYEDAIEELEEAKAALAEALSALDNAVTKKAEDLAKAEELMDAAKGALDNAQAAYDDAKAANDALKAQAEADATSVTAEALEEAQAAEDAAKATLDEAQAAFDTAKASVEQLLKAGEIKVAQAAEAQAEAQAAYDAAKAANDALKAQAAEDETSVTAEALEEAQAAEDAAKATLDEAKAAYDAARAELEAADKDTVNAKKDYDEATTEFYTKREIFLGEKKPDAASNPGSAVEFDAEGKVIVAEDAETKATEDSKCGKYQKATTARDTAVADLIAKVGENTIVNGYMFFDKYKSLENSYNQNFKKALATELFTIVYNSVTVSNEGYEDLVDEIYEMLIDNFQYAYYYNMSITERAIGSSLFTSSSTEEDYLAKAYYHVYGASFERFMTEYAVATYFGVQTPATYEDALAYVKAEAISLAKDRILVFAAAEALGVKLTDDQFDEYLEEKGYSEITDEEKENLRVGYQFTVLINELLQGFEIKSEADANGYYATYIDFTKSTEGGASPYIAVLVNKDVAVNE